MEEIYYSAPLPDLGFAYPVALHAWGGKTNVHDYRMSDGTILTLHVDEVMELRRKREAAEALVTTGKREGAT